MHLAQSNSQIVQEKHFDECENDAFRCIGRRWRYRYEEKKH